MLTILDSKLIVNERETLYNDWRDWFLKDDTTIKQEIHKTKLMLYFDNEFVEEIMMPINAKSVNFEISATTDTPMSITSVKYIIPEMGLLREQSVAGYMRPGDNLNFSGDLSFD